jgi:thioesterase DpgC
VNATGHADPGAAAAAADHGERARLWLGADADTLDRGAGLAHLARGRALLAELPVVGRRNPDSATLAQQLCATLRDRLDPFVNVHAPTMYRELTGSGRLRLNNLIDRASDAYPGLLPGPAARANDLEVPPAERDFVDIDLGLFLRGVLRDAEAGNHLLDTSREPTNASLAAAATLERTGELRLGTVHVERIDSVGHVSLANVHTLNAEDNALMADLELAVDAVMLAPSTRAGVLRGAVMRHPRYAGRRIFSAGINLKHLAAGRISFLDFLIERELGLLSKMVRGLAGPRGSAPTPWVAVVDGFAIGGGMQIVLAADHVIAADDAWFSLPAAQEGIVPGTANLRLARVAGTRIARSMVLRGTRVAATDPDARPFCDEVVGVDDLTRRAQQVATELSAPAVVPNKLMLALAEEPQDTFRRYAAEFCVVQAVRMYSPDVLEKVGAFAQRNNPT